MSEPTQEQIKEFWEWCEARCLNCRHLISTTIKPDMCCCYAPELPIDLNNLFKYAVPKLPPTNKSYTALFLLLAWVTDILNNPDKDPALALFWALDKVRNG